MPILHLIAGPNGAGKSTFVDRILQPVTKLPFVNADIIAAKLWPDDPAAHAYDASRAAAAERQLYMADRRSFITETVFSHPSKSDLVDHAIQLGYLVHLYVVMVPVDLTVRRVAERVLDGGHDVPEHKVRERYDRLWQLIARARGRADRAEFFDNTSASTPYRTVATYEHGRPVGQPHWPTWSPSSLLLDSQAD